MKEQSVTDRSLAPTTVTPMATSTLPVYASTSVSSAVPSALTEAVGAANAVATGSNPIPSKDTPAAWRTVTRPAWNVAGGVDGPVSTTPPWQARRVSPLLAAPISSGAARV